MQRSSRQWEKRKWETSKEGAGEALSRQTKRTWSGIRRMSARRISFQGRGGPWQDKTPTWFDLCLTGKKIEHEILIVNDERWLVFCFQICLTVSIIVRNGLYWKKDSKHTWEWQVPYVGKIADELAGEGAWSVTVPFVVDVDGTPAPTALDGAPSPPRAVIQGRRSNNWLQHRNLQWFCNSSPNQHQGQQSPRLGERTKRHSSGLETKRTNRTFDQQNHDSEWILLPPFPTWNFAEPM